MTDTKEAAEKRAAALKGDDSKLLTRAGDEVVGFVKRDDEDDSGDH